MNQYSLFWIKPDAFYDNQDWRKDTDTLRIPLPGSEDFIQEIRDALRAQNLEIAAEKRYRVSEEIAWMHYDEHRWKVEKFNFLLGHMTSGDSYWIVFYGEDAVVKGRQILADIRNKYLLDAKWAYHNMTHASDSEASARREIQLHFPDFAF